MGQPKAKWEQMGQRCWRAFVGGYELVALAHEDECYAELFADERAAPLWHQTATQPCDIVDLMLLAEAELERRLRGAADTMDGAELVAEQEAVAVEQLLPYCNMCCDTRAPLTDGKCDACLLRGSVLEQRHAELLAVPDNRADEPWERRLARATPAVSFSNMPSLAWALTHLRAGRECTDCFGVTYRMVGENRFNYRLLLDSQRGGTCDKLPNKDGWRLAAAAEGSREWAIERMARGGSCVDVDGDIWWRSEGRYFCSATNGEHGQAKLPAQPEFNRGWRW